MQNVTDSLHTKRYIIDAEEHQVGRSVRDGDDYQDETIEDKIINNLSS